MYSPQDAVITAVPFALAVTTPLLFTAATFVLLDFHVILSVRFVVTLRVVFVLPLYKESWKKYLIQMCFLLLYK
mgnify:CR=1 FL=1